MQKYTFDTPDFSRFARTPMAKKAFVQYVKHVSRANAKAQNSRTQVLKVRNWGIKDAHFN